MSEVLRTVKQAVNQQVKQEGFISLDFDTVRDIMPYADRDSVDGVGEELSMDEGYYYEVDEKAGLLHIAQFEMQLNRARNESKESLLV